MKEAEELVWREILQEDKDNFTPEFRAKVIKVIQKIKGEI